MKFLGLRIIVRPSQKDFYENDYISLFETMNIIMVFGILLIKENIRRFFKMKDDKRIKPFWSERARTGFLVAELMSFIAGGLILTMSYKLDNEITKPFYPLVGAGFILLGMLCLGVVFGSVRE